MNYYMYASFIYFFSFYNINIYITSWRVYLWYRLSMSVSEGRRIHNQQVCAVVPSLPAGHSPFCAGSRVFLKVVRAFPSVQFDSAGVFVSGAAVCRKTRREPVRLVYPFVLFVFEADPRFSSFKPYTSVPVLRLGVWLCRSCLLTFSVFF